MSENLTLADIYRSFARYWLVLLCAVLVFAAVGLVVYAAYPLRYTASAQHTVEPIPVLSSGSTLNTVSMETEAVIATSDVVLEKAAAGLDRASVKSLRDATTIQVPRNSQILTFEVTTESADRSAEWANAIASSYGAQRVQSAQAVVDKTSTELSATIAKLRAAYDAQSPNSSQRAATQQQIEALVEQQAALIATPLFSGTVVTSAVAPQSSDRPPMYVFLAAGLLLGALIGGVVAVTLRSVRASSDTEARGPGSREPAGREPTRDSDVPRWDDGDQSAVE